ncbi:MAG: serine/threonine-protein kinase PknG [Actinomycetota bacterium]|nr:serine/threonine-protein kinase PknG [Actinomycetota bacterium]
MRCTQPGCTGTIAPDGYCDTCGTKAATPVPVKRAIPHKAPAAASRPAPSPPAPRPAVPGAGGTMGTLTTGSARAHGTRRSGSSARTTSRRTGGIGAGLVDVSPAPVVDPATVVLADPTVSEDKRYCSNCGAPVGRARADAPHGRLTGVCSQCRHRFDFEPKLRRGEIIGGQYEVAGALAHGGLGWIYLARDKAVNDRWVVLKGLLDAGDEAAMRVAVAERQFLAELSHPNIVEIFNFVTDRGSGYIVMEYVGGRSLKQMLSQRRAANGGKADPMPVEDALAFILAIVPAFAYLHSRALLYCDFKPDNLIQVGDQVKLIDMGAVRRLDDPSADVYGTAGFQAPEIADDGPSVPSDVYTIGRTLAVLTMDFRGYQKQFEHSLPDPADHPALARFDSFHRLLLKATAPQPDDRFQTVGELGEQAIGVLREVVARETGKPQVVPSTVFGPAPVDGTVPPLAVDAGDPSAAFLSALGAGTPDSAITEIRRAVASGTVAESVEVRLRLARALIESGDPTGAAAQLDRVEADDPWEWRAVWLRGVGALAGGRLPDAAAAFDRCRSEVPGEVAPKLAAAITAERAGEVAAAAALYETVVTIDPNYVAAAQGLARCRAAAGDVAGALAAYERIPATHRARSEAEVEAVRMLIGSARFQEAAEHLAAAADLDQRRRVEVEVELYEAALRAVGARVPATGGPRTLGDRPFTERGLRLALEEALRRRARLASDPAERIALVDRANHERPLTVV